jgi:hypothetical protein
VHDFRHAVDFVPPQGQGPSQRYRHAGFLADLANGRERQVFVAIDLSLGHRPVVVAGTVHEENFGSVLALSGNKASGREDW